MHEDELDETPSADRGERVQAAAGASAPDPVAEDESRRQWRAHLILVAILAPVLVVALVAGGYVAYLDSVVRKNVRQEQLLPTDDPHAPGRRAGAGTAENYLLVGLDRQPGQKLPPRSDAIIWMHVDKDRSRVDLIHFPRDYEVNIPGHGRDKLNAAYNTGGAQLLVKTLQPMMGTRVDHVAILDFERFSRMTDAIGGIDLDVPADLASPQFPAGKRHFTGDEALTFVRERQALDQQDISRGKRQQLYLRALLVRVLSNDVLNDPVTFAKFVDAGTQNLVLDQTFPKEKLRDKAFEMRGVRGDQIHFWSAPWVGVGDDPRVGSLVFPNPWLLADLGQNLAEDTMGRYVDEETPEKYFDQTPEQQARTQERAGSGAPVPTGVRVPPSRSPATGLN